MKLTSEGLQTLNSKQVANIIRNLGAGKTITKREKEILAAEFEQYHSQRARISIVRGHFAWEIVSKRWVASVTR